MVRLPWRILNVQVDSPQVYLMEGLTPTLLVTDFAFKKAFELGFAVIVLAHL